MLILKHRKKHIVHQGIYVVTVINRLFKKMIKLTEVLYIKVYRSESILKFLGFSVSFGNLGIK